MFKFPVVSPLPTPQTEAIICEELHFSILTTILRVLFLGFLSRLSVFMAGGGVIMSVGCAATESHVNVSDLNCHLRQCWCPWSVLTLRAEMRSMAHAAAAKGCVDVHSLCCYGRPCWGLCHVLTPETVDVCGLCCWQKPCRSPWLLLSLTVKVKKTTFAMLLMAANSQLRKKNIILF